MVSHGRSGLVASLRQYNERNICSSRKTPEELGEGRRNPALTFTPTNDMSPQDAGPLILPLVLFLLLRSHLSPFCSCPVPPSHLLPAPPFC